MLSTLGTGYFLKIAKIIPSKKNHSLQIAKISFCKTQKSPICTNKLPQKFRATRYVGLCNIFSHNSYFILGLRIIIGNPKKVFN